MWDATVELLDNEVFAKLVIGIVAMAWAAFQGSDWYAKFCKARFDKAFLAVEAGAQITYETYVRECKIANEDGKLTPEERKDAREMAIEAAKRFGLSHGVDVGREITEEYIDLALDKAIAKLRVHK